MLVTIIATPLNSPTLRFSSKPAGGDGESTFSISGDMTVKF